MRVQQPVRDRSMSLWQSAVRQTLAGHDLSDDAKKQIEYGVSLHAQAVAHNTPLTPLPEVAPGATASAPASATLIAHASKAAFDALQAHQDGDTQAHKSLFNTLSDLVSKYSTWDLSGWAQCGWYYVKY
jgi:hypothetical protein